MSTENESRQDLVTGKETGQKIKETSILVIGAGAAGNEVLKNLALMGFGKITVIDFDSIEDSNLARTTLFRIKDIGSSKAKTAETALLELALHPNPKIRGIHGNVMTDLGKGEFFDHDIVVCCVDTLIARAYINDCCVKFKKPLIEVGFKGFNADISFVYPISNESPNLRDLIGYTKFDFKRNSCSGLIARDENLEHIPTIQSTSALAGGLIAGEIVKFLGGNSTLLNHHVKYFGTPQEIHKFKIAKNKNEIGFIEIVENPIELNFDNNATIREILEFINEKWENFFILSLPYVFLESWECKICKAVKSPGKWKEFLFDDDMDFGECQLDADSDDCRTSGNWKSYREFHLKSDSDLLNKSLSYFGIPSRDVLLFQGVEGEKRIVLNFLLKHTNL